jgi:hypothetical protein
LDYTIRIDDYAFLLQCNEETIRFLHKSMFVSAVITDKTTTNYCLVLWLLLKERKYLQMIGLLLIPSLKRYLDWTILFVLKTDI